MNKQLVNFLLILGMYCLRFHVVAQQLDMKKMKALKPRSIGPAGMSGRVTSIDVVHNNPEVMYIGTASGGLWKSESSGISWEPIFDKEKVLSIGAVAIQQSNPDVVWAGTGEGNPRNSQSSGAGIYKSLDAGKNWQLMGLEKTRTIHRIIIHPDDPNTVYVAALGSAWGDHPERGLYKTTDGGKSWRKILFVNLRTGVADVVMDPRNPDKLIAATWEYRRWPWFFKSGGKGSGLHITHDGGETWQQRTQKDGLPQGELGRIGLAIAQSNPEVVYALIEAKKNALYRSDDGGVEWKKINDGKNIGNRPFYYADIFVDPKNENRLYSLYSVVSKSEDGGRSFRVILPYSGFTGVHPDHHAWWIHPDRPNFIINGNDGGLAITYDQGENWRFVENLPLAQFYHINIDMQTPYNVYGGMQDNGSWQGPSAVWRYGGIKNAYWEELFFGDGFDVVPDPERWYAGYAMAQGGFLARYDLRTGSSQIIRPVHPEGVELRFNWNAGIAQNPFNATTIYYGSQFLHKTTDRGESWQIISKDLTTDDPKKQKYKESGGLTDDVTNAENHTAIVAIAPSPVKQGVIWVGTDDGNVQVTKDGGAIWTNTVANIRGVPSGSWVAQIHASTYRENEAFVVINNYRRNDWTPYLYRTKDFGRSWQKIVGDKQIWGYVLSFVQDPIAENLYFLGTEFGLYVSIDAGKNWTQWREGYPHVSTMDMKIHPRDHDLVVGTFGRAAYIFDDIRPLRTIAQQGTGILANELKLFVPPSAILATYKRPTGTRFAADAMYSGENKPYGLTLSYWVKAGKQALNEDSDKKMPADTLKAEVIDIKGEIIRTLTQVPDSGMNRITWALNMKGVRYPREERPKKNAAEPSGPQVLPGQYKIRMTYRKNSDSAMVTVRQDPRVEIAQTDTEQIMNLKKSLLKRVAAATKAVDRLKDAQEVIKIVEKQLKNTNDTALVAKLKKNGKDLEKNIKELLERFNPAKEAKGYSYDDHLMSSKLALLNYYLNTSTRGVNATHQLLMEQNKKELQNLLSEVNTFFETIWNTYEKTVKNTKLSPFESYEPLRLD